MKKIVFVTLLLSMFGLTSCSKEETPNYYSSAQKEILDVLHGKFSYTMPWVEWTTTIEFLEQYETPITITVKGEERENYVHGKYHITYEYSNNSSYERYYHIAYDGQTITTCPRLDWSSPNVQEFSLINSTSFKIREIGATMWDTYTKQ